MVLTGRTCNAFLWVDRLYGVEGRTGWDGYVVWHGDVGYMEVSWHACDGCCGLAGCMTWKVGLVLGSYVTGR